MTEIKFYHAWVKELHSHRYFDTYIHSNEFVMNTTGVIDTILECIIFSSNLAQEELFRRLPSAFCQPMPLFGSSPQKDQDLQVALKEDGSDIPHRE